MEERTVGADSTPGANAPHQLNTPMASAPDSGFAVDASSHESARAGDATRFPSARNGWVEWVRQGLRAATLRSVERVPEGPSARLMLLMMAVVLVIISGVSRLTIDGPASFDLGSWLVSWAPEALLVFGAWLVLNWGREKPTHASPTAAWYLLFGLATLPIILTDKSISILGRRGYLEWWPREFWMTGLSIGTFLFWYAIATWRVSRAVTRSTLAAAGLVLHVITVLILSGWYLNTDEWQPVDSYDGYGFASMEVSQEVFESQQALLQESLQAIAPSTEGEREVYGLVYAPYSQDVFLRESAMVQEVLEERFDARGRVVRLVNNTATAAELPWATPLNLKRSLEALAGAMDTEQDVLVMYLTSHGGADFKLAAGNWPLTVKELTADQLRAMLDEVDIRYRVIVVSACYSGGWIEPLQSENTLIMTAADEDHTSYGCGFESELTFFGRAVFDEQLRKTLSFEEAFKAAVPVIKQREIEAKKDDGFSNPQIFVGENIRAVLDELSGRIAPSSSREL